MAVQQRHSTEKPKQAAQRPPQATPTSQKPVALPELGVPKVLQRAVTQPGRMTPGNVRMLQRAYGNRATTRLLPRSHPRFPIQAKLTVNPAGDRYEHEADRVAEQVLRGRGQSSGGIAQGVTALPGAGAVQRTYSSLGRLEKIAADALALHKKKKKKVRKEYKARYKANNELLTPREGRAIEILSRTTKGKKYLKKKGFMTLDEVKRYSTGGNFRDWEKKPEQHRMQVADYQFFNRIKNTPGYWKGLSVFKRTSEIHERDLEEWAKTLKTPSGLLAPDVIKAGKTVKGLKQPKTLKGVMMTRRKLLARNAAAMNIVKRIFIVLQKGLVYYDAQDQWHNWKAPVAVALSHGGRVNVRIPSVAKGGDPDAFFKWLTGGKTGRKKAGMYERLAGTHRVAIGKGPKGSFKEKKGVGAAIMAGIGKTRHISLEKGTTTHYGLDLPIGGLGKLDINGDVILPNGSYGHLYIAYKSPTTKRDGALLIGAETDAPHKTSALGHHHHWMPGLISSAEFSTTGGKKSDKIGREKGGMMVDLAGISRVEGDWLDQLKGMEEAVKEGAITSRELVGKKMRLY